LAVADSKLQIGEVAALAGVSVDTVRYYEQRHLLDRPARSSGGFRLFTLETVERIRFIKQAQDIGFSLNEVKALLTGGGGATQCQHVRDLLQGKIGELDDRMKKLRDFKRILARHLTACENELNQHGTAASCPVIVNLEPATQKEKGGDAKKNK
jgi:DNA-binding transcriptional MerR regulator